MARYSTIRICWRCALSATARPKPEPSTPESVILEIRAIQKDARENGFRQRPAWPVIVMISPKGWTGPKVVDGVQIEGTFRAHQVPLDQLAEKPAHIKILEDWMKSYRPEELFDDLGAPVPEVIAATPAGSRRMGMNP